LHTLHLVVCQLPFFGADLIVGASHLDQVVGTADVDVQFSAICVVFEGIVERADGTVDGLAVRIVDEFKRDGVRCTGCHSSLESAYNCVF
jgi:hypothetical protein